MIKIVNRRGKEQVATAASSRNGWRAFLAGCVLALYGSAGAVEVAQQPLYTGSKVPGNLVLVPSVEYPTIHSQANIGEYDHSRKYSGYFDSEKCYLYNYDALNEANRHFYPARKATSFNCPQKKEWSGNYLNWASTQTIDPFRSALTGGYRVRDTASETFLEKARHAPGYGLFPNRRMPSSCCNHDLVKRATAASWGTIDTMIEGLGNKMRFSSSGSLGLFGVDYNPAVHNLDDVLSQWSVVYEVSMRVKVCDASVGVEPNCRQYGNSWKPEGLIQEYQDRIRYSIFGYLNESGNQRNGGVMRARQKFVGPNTYYPEEGVRTNAAAEWNASTGQLVRNPDSTDARNTLSTIQDSGVINYLNKFGQMTNQAPKSNDPVSELYYSALRYVRGQGNYDDYSRNIDHNKADGFPVITKWDDPIRYSCQLNAALGIGDVYTHADHDLPDADRKIARAYTQKIFDLEGINRRAENEFTGRGNSAYIAGLAYYAHTNDLRPDDARYPATLGKQTLSTYWVDVRENQTLVPRNENQYWLAAKYGGFRVPAGFDPLETGALPTPAWHATNDYLRSGFNGDVTNVVTNYPRADNFYVASDAERMVASLREAFRNIVASAVGSGSGFASSSTVLESGGQTFQGRFIVEDGSWGGDLQAYDVNQATGALTPTWTASSKLPLWNQRKILVRGDGTALVNLASDPLPIRHRAAFGSDWSQVADYLRGDRSNERPNGTLRKRGTVLGAIVNSEPVFVGAPNRNLFIGATWPGASSYQKYAADNAGRVKAVYVGGNDGMLHGFNAQTGAELFAFVPDQVISSPSALPAYVRQGYEQRYLVDGELTVADVYDSTAQAWRTVLVGTMGRGGRGMFALDVTNPADPKFLWEKSATDSPAFGNNLGKPIIAQVASGDWQVLLGNGPNSGTGRAQLIAASAIGGQLKAFDMSSAGDSGLTGINVWSSVRGGYSDRVYAGDLRGNLWRISYTGADASPTRIFSARYGADSQVQPITATPLVARRPNTDETWIFFGTGQYLNSADVASKRVQSWYGLKDPGGSTAVLRSELREIKIAAEGVIDGTPVRGFERLSNIDSQKGWYMDLRSPGKSPEGERMVVPNRFRGFALIGTTRIPDSTDYCNPSGRGFIMAIDPFSGGRLAGGSFFDVDGDGNFTETIGDTGIPVSGIGTPSGPNNPIFIGDVMQVNLDNTDSQSVGTNAQGTQPRRVSWRELLRN